MAITLILNKLKSLTSLNENTTNFFINGNFLRNEIKLFSVDVVLGFLHDSKHLTVVL